MNVSVYPSNTPNPHESYIADYANDLNNKEQFEDNFTNRPISIYEEIVNCNMNNSTVNEVPTEIQSNIFLPLPEKASLLDELKEVLKEPTTYKSLIHLINFKYSLLTYFTLFPSYLYNKVNYINNYHVTFIFGILSVSGLLLVTINGWLSNNTNKRAIFLAALSWLGSLGYLSKEIYVRCFYGIKLIVSFSHFRCEVRDFVHHRSDFRMFQYICYGLLWETFTETYSGRRNYHNTLFLKYNYKFFSHLIHDCW